MIHVPRCECMDSCPHQDSPRSQVGTEDCRIHRFLIKVVGEIIITDALFPASFKQCFLWLLASLTALFSCDYPQVLLPEAELEPVIINI